MKTYTILNLGAGVQSGAIYCLMADGEIPMADYALFADTQEEPIWVYEQLTYLKSQPGPNIVEVTAGKIGDDLIKGVPNKNGGTRFASIPAHTTFQEGVKGGKTRRQCTREYKIEPIEKWMRRDLLGLEPKQHIPKNVTLTNLFGFSTDESSRAVKMQIQFAQKVKQWGCGFPLFDDDIMMTRLDAQNYINERSGFVWRSSRCVFCPLQMNNHWREIKEHDPAGFQRAVDVDDAIRQDDAICRRGAKEIMYVHRSCIPLDKSTLDEGQDTLFQDDGECDQGCFL